MNEIISKVIEDIFSEDAQHPLFAKAPLAIYVKDRHGKYINRNHVAAEMMVQSGFSNYQEISSVFGKTDKQIFGTEDAYLFEAHDVYLFEHPEKETNTFLEQVTINSNEQVDLLSKKQLLVAPDGEKIGLIGYSMLLDPTIKEQLTCKMNMMHSPGKAQLIELLQTCLRTTNLHEIKNCGLLLRKLTKIFSDSEFYILSQLTMSEFVSICFVARGLSNKEIARLLHISDRTLEKHVTSSKYKLKCSHRHQLATWLWELLTNKLLAVG